MTFGLLNWLKITVNRLLLSDCKNTATKDDGEILRKIMQNLYIKAFCANALSGAIKSVMVVACVPTLAAYANTQVASIDTPSVDLGVLKISVSADASQAGLKKSYAGGQVATGGRVGILGNKDNLDTPFATTAYTQAYIKNSMANSVGDVLKQDPSVRVARGFGNFQESYVVRGFVTNSDDTMMNGLYGILPRQYIASELFERVQIVRGAGTFLHGIAPGGTNKGGTIALLPKRAGNTPKKELGLGFGAGGRGNIFADIGQRFGENKQFGVRVNATKQSGNTAIDNEKASLSLVAAGVDYRQDGVRLSADLGYQNHQLNSTRTNVALATSAVPNAPAAKTNWAQPWTYSNEQDVFGTLRGEYDINDMLTVYGAYGFRHGKEANSLGNLTVSNVNGDGTTYRFDNSRKDTVNTGELGVKGLLQLGGVYHDWTASINAFGLDKKNAYKFDWQNQQNTNLYRPVLTVKADWSATAYAGGDLANPITTGKTTLTSLALADTVSLFDDKVQATIGIRKQYIHDEDFAYGIGVKQSDYKKSKITPALALVYRPSALWSVYANYAQNLQKGQTVPLTYVSGTQNLPYSNAGQALSPYVTEQIELGAKYDLGNIGGSVAVFSTDKPRYAKVGTAFARHGKNTHTGLELNTYGEPMIGVRVLGGVTLLSTKQRQTDDPAIEGKEVIGAAKVLANIGVEYDLPQIQGFTLTGGVHHTGKRYADDANKLAVSGYTTINVGARYQTQIAGTPITVRGSIDNLTGKNYWASVGGYESTNGNNAFGYLTVGEPRTFKLSATALF